MTSFWLTIQGFSLPILTIAPASHDDPSDLNDHIDYVEGTDIQHQLLLSYSFILCVLQMSPLSFQISYPPSNGQELLPYNPVSFIDQICHGIPKVMCLKDVYMTKCCFTDVNHLLTTFFSFNNVIHVFNHYQYACSEPIALHP